LKLLHLFPSSCLLIAQLLVWITLLKLLRTRVTKMFYWIHTSCILMKIQVTSYGSCHRAPIISLAIGLQLSLMVTSYDSCFTIQEQITLHQFLIALALIIVMLFQQWRNIGIVIRLSIFLRALMNNILQLGHKLCWWIPSLI
jgi:hypothetical protein